MDKLAKILTSLTFQKFIIFVIIVNAVVLGMQTSPRLMAKWGNILNLLDDIALYIFIVELTAKILCFRLSFFKSGWNIFDFLIVGISLAPSSGSLSVLRAFRILRILRLISVLPSMRRIVSALLRSLSGLNSVAMLLALIFYVSAVLATNLYGHQAPEQFGTIGDSLFTLFEVMTMEGWSDGVVKPLMEQSPNAWVFFIPFMVITGFCVLNLFIGIIVSAMEEVSNEENIDTNAEILKRLDRIEKSLKPKT